jgi:hypothetical protein
MPGLVIDGEMWDVTISDEEQRVLREQAIDEDRPGTILRDFDTLLAFIGTAGLKTTGKFYFLPNSKLDELNSQMSHPVAHHLKRPTQRSFPHLHGLYLLLRASGIGVGVGIPPGGRLMLDQQMLAAWRELNATERYFTLLESWLVQGSPEIIAERVGWSSGCFNTLNWLYRKLRDRKTMIPADRLRGHVLFGTMEFVSAALLELFGWARLEYSQPATGEGVTVTSLERLAFGDAMLSVLNVWYISHQWPTYHDERPANPGTLQAPCQPYFPEWRRLLTRPATTGRDAVFTWRISLGRAWRRIAAPAHLSLETLAVSILTAFDVGFDHLYCFEFRDSHGRKQRIACPYEQDAETYTDETCLGDLQLVEGGIMTFIFDYSSPSRFTVKLEHVGPPDPGLAHPQVIAEGGPPLKPYVD